MQTFSKGHTLMFLVFLMVASLGFGQSAQEWCDRAYDALKVEDAMQCYANAIEADPDYVFAYANRGRLKQQEGDLAEAIADFNKAVEISPQYGAAYHWRGLAKKELGDTEGSREDIEKGKQLLETVDHDLLFVQKQIERDPHNTKLLLDKAYHLRERGKLEEAVAAFDQYVMTVGKLKNHLVYFDRAKVRIQLGDLEGAEADYSNVIRGFPSVPEAYQKRAEVREMRGNKNGAIEDRVRAAELPPQIRAENGAQSLSKLKALDEGVTDPQLLLQRAQMYFKNSEFGEVIADTDAIIEQDIPSEFQQVLPLAYYLRSQAKGRLGDKDGQEADIRRMRELSRGPQDKNE